QSVGVPSTAYQRGRTSCRRIGRWIEIACEDALCSESGATTHTSPSPSIAVARAWIPSDMYPSSFETRILGISLIVTRFYARSPECLTERLVALLGSADEEDREARAQDRPPSPHGRVVAGRELPLGRADLPPRQPAPPTPPPARARE